MDNKALRTAFEKEQFVIITKKSGVHKYVSKSYGRNHQPDFTVQLNKARKFDTFRRAESYADDNNINIIAIAVVKNTLLLQAKGESV